MLVRGYQVLGGGVLGGYALSALLGWEYGNGLLVRQVPPVNAVVSSAGGGWSGRTARYHAYSSSGTRSGWGGFGTGGK